MISGTVKPASANLSMMKRNEKKNLQKKVSYLITGPSCFFGLIAMIVADVGHYGCSFLYIKVIRIDRKKRK